MQMRHLKNCPRISASSSRMRPRKASTTGVSASLLGDTEAPSSVSFCWPTGVAAPGSGFTSTRLCAVNWSGVSCCGMCGAFGEMTASRSASLSFCSFGVPSIGGATTSASVYCTGPNASSPSTTKSKSSSSWLPPPPPAPAPERLLDEVARPAAAEGK